MSTKFMRAAVLCTLLLALTGCIFSNKPLFDLSKGATDLPVGLFEMRSSSDKKLINVERHGNLYLYGEEKTTEKAILSFHAIGDGFYLVMAFMPGAPINYGVLDARSKEKLPFTYLQCFNMPDVYVPQPDLKGNERCNATDPERLIAIANRNKADMMAGQVEASRLFEYIQVR